MAYTIKNWLKGMVGDYEITDSTFESILFNNGLDADTPAVETSEMERDLSLADLYMAIATSSSKSGSIYDSDGGWQRDGPRRTWWIAHGFVSKPTVCTPSGTPTRPTLRAFS